MSLLGEYIYTKPTSEDYGVGGEPYFSYDDCMSMNVSFAKAMLKARTRGLEKFTLGPMPPPTTDFNPVYIDRPPHRSGMGSCAADCAEHGLAETLSKRTTTRVSK